jgi:hypothetical protein
VPVACPMARSEAVCSGHSRTRQIVSELQILRLAKHDKPVPKLIVRRQDGLDGQVKIELAAVAPAALAAFWPHNDAQRCHLLRTSERYFGRSAPEWQVADACDTVYGSEGWGFESLRARPSERAQLTGLPPVAGPLLLPDGSSSEPLSASSIAVRAAGRGVAGARVRHTAMPLTCTCHQSRLRTARRRRSRDRWRR